MSDKVRYDLLLYVDPKQRLEKSKQEIQDTMLRVARALPGFIRSEADVLSDSWYAYPSGGPTTGLESDRPVVRFSIQSEPMSPSWINKLDDALRAVADLHIRAARDVPVGALGHWSPSSVDGWSFGTTERVLQAIGINEVWKQGWKGRGVNVVIVDRGLDRHQIDAANYAGTLARLNPQSAPAPTDPPPNARAEILRHGTMVARAVLAIAPEAKILDLRTVPEPKAVIATLGNVAVAYSSALKYTPSGAPCVLVNPWGVFESGLERPLRPFELSYVDDPTHFFHQNVRQTSDDQFGSPNPRVCDMVFAAGNGGGFDPIWRQGRSDRGPDRSILGANGHPSALSVGAVRSDGIWLGYSSQGQSRLRSQGPAARQKPDLCAPSNFVLREDRSWFCSGSSAASAVAAGVVAVLRSWELSQTKYPRRSPSRLIEILRHTATRPRGTSWSDRTGMGMINAACALAMLMRADPDT